ncbi:MAG: hypothetical protein JWR24_1142 [Actinoallomurus sp.]|nr:hypothetical protein [Actinoallomurus sp.]
MSPEWRKSSRSGGADDNYCVEVARLSGVSWIRDSENPGDGHRTPPRPEPAVPAQSERGDLDR